MSLAIASARDQYVLLRNFTTGKWENIAGDGKTCRIQVMKKADGDHLLRITPDGGQKRELKLSKENRIHFARGFIQVPVADSKELYGIKFKETNLVEGEEFYTKLIKAIGVPCSYPQTTIGTDGNPDPVGQKPAAKPAATKSVLQSLPPWAQTGSKPANISQLPKAKAQPSSQAPPPVFATLGSQPSKFIAPHQGWKPEATPQVIKEVKPDSQRKFHRHPSPQKQPVAGGGSTNYHDLHTGSSAHKQPTDAGRPINDQGASAAKYDNIPMGSPRNKVTFAPSQTPQQNLTPQKSKQPMYQNVTPYYSESPAPPGRSKSADVTVVGSKFPPESGFSQQPNPPSVGQLKSRFQQEAKPHPPSTPSNQPTVVNGHSKEKDYFDGATASNVVDKTSTSGPSVARQQQPSFLSQPRPSASPKLQRSSLKPSDMKSVAEAMSDAMNRCDERLAREKFEALMNFMRTSKTGGRCEMSFSTVREPEPEPSQSTFTLNVQVEFQNPNKEPIPIFLDDVSPDTTINVLSARVEHHFYIPRLSQNWIIGTRLVKGTDMNKSLRDFDIRGSGVGGGGVSVFMYVMHTKKAQVPNEAARVRQQHVQHRQQQQQSTQSTDQERPPVARVAWAADPIAT